MLSIRYDKVETPFMKFIPQENIAKDTVVETILNIFDIYAADRKYTKSLCQNHWRLTMFGLKAPDISKSIKVPIIAVGVNDKLLSGLSFNVKEYIYVPETKYISICEIHFKRIIRDVIFILGNIMDKNKSTRDFNYIIRRLEELLNENIKLEMTGNKQVTVDPVVENVKC